MTNTAGLPGSIQPSLDDLRHRWGWFVALGLLFLVLGTVAFFNVVLATVASVYMIGVLMIIGGIVQIVHAFGVRRWSSFFWWLAGGIVYAVGGFFAFQNPLLASSVLTLILAVALAMSGAMRIMAGFRAKPNRSWGWMVAGGIVTLLAGLVIALGWPVNSLFILGLFLAIDFVFQGWGFIAFGLALRR